MSKLGKDQRAFKITIEHGCLDTYEKYFFAKNELRGLMRGSPPGEGFEGHPPCCTIFFLHKERTYHKFWVKGDLFEVLGKIDRGEPLQTTIPAWLGHYSWRTSSAG